MAKLSDLAKGIGRQIAKVDRVHTRHRSSRAEHAIARATALDVFEATRPAAYAITWYIHTGRSTPEFDAAFIALSPARFAQIAIDIAAGGLSVREQSEQWAAAVA